MAKSFERSCEESRIQQMQYRVFYTADVLVDRQPVMGSLCVHGIRGVRVAKADEVPGGIDEGVERVGVAPRRPIAAGTGDVLPRWMMVERIAGNIKARVGRKKNGQLRFRHWHDAAIAAMHHRDGTSPIALTRDQPVAQSEKSR